MDNKEIGRFILELRKSKNMTQKELAEKLNITDKAVSKWERGMGYPDITTVPILAKILGVSTSELLVGRRMIQAENENSAMNITETDAMITNAMEYVEQTHKQKKSRANEIAIMILSLAFLISMFVCLLCNYVIEKKFDWSLYVVGSEVTAWLFVAPIFLLKKYRGIASMTALSITIMPLLLLIEYLCPVKNWVIPFALPIVIITLVSMWVAVILVTYTKIRRIYLTAFTLFLFGVAVNLIISSFVNNYFTLDNSNNISVPITSITFGFVAVLLLIIGYTKKEKKRTN